MSSITDGFKDVFMAGIGAMALGAEKSKELVDQLIEKGELTVDQGQAISADLIDRATQTAGKTAVSVRDDLIAAHLATLSKDERDAFAAKVAEMAAAANEKDAAMNAQADEVEAVISDEVVADADAKAGVPPIE
ncbi:phasin family protein [Adlercreutzia faecimuris]|uniref:Polyhydroxyalkanoate synthesis regulator phasin n=1 Tax=Adlercreutzia faecimuris TaxID=2897341 RepID=A0ABS9WIZ0_9ACTN|nr:hypothetical protein [Adlercreutzia sp. JBNU-10]MCI2242843.1 hypothetical protein [Adlercreutzia sp. JBNU-10]